MTTLPEQFKTQHLHGVWPAIPLPWREDDSLDAGLLREMVRRYRAAGVAGVYTTGTDGELSALDFDDFKVMVDAFASSVQEVGLPAQVGCTWLHTKGVLERVQYAVDRGIRAVQIAPPFWTELNDMELTRFFATLSERFPDIAVIHYNIAKARFLHGSDYARILPHAPTLVGSKHTGGSVSEIIGCVTDAPSMHHFVVDGQAMPGAMLGAKGIYSFTANLNPVWAVEFFAACARGDAHEAARRKLLEARFFDAWGGTWGEVTASQSLAKMATRCGVAPEITLRVRAPYLEGTKAQVDALRALLDGEFRELRYEVQSG
ncbi:MAG: dihydrodipicolinate synthase family protein [Chloroflexi bacterium]|nr:dihydrodipicolinate synthase family protein [Chloroflexota bacterium]